MLTLLCLLIASTIVAPVVIYQLGRPGFGLLALVPAGGFFWVLSHFGQGTFAAGGALEVSIAWMPTAHLNLQLRLDGLGALFSLIILGVGALVLLYCWGYFDKTPLRLTIFAAQLLGFATAMFGLVASDSLLLMYIFWEATSLLSFLLVSYYGERATSRKAAVQAFMVTVLGGLAMLVGIVLLGRQTGIWNLSGLTAFGEVADTPYITAAIALIMAGALTKSAIAPAHFWLPGAMAAPTPVSAYLHSAAMVKAGIYLVARLAPEFNVVTAWYLVIVPLAMFTMLLGGWMALKQTDLKLVLAYGTVSQLGFITTIVAVGSREAMLAGLALTVAHSLFKATLFMVVGAVDHSAGTRSLDQLSGLGKKEPLVFAIAAIAGLSMAGIPPLFGFVAKEAVLEAMLHEELLVGMPRQLILLCMVLGSILTMAYTLRFLWGTFAVKKPGDFPGAQLTLDKDGYSPAVAQMHPIGPLLWLSPLVLTVLTIWAGLIPGPLSRLINDHLDGRFGVDPEAPYLALWHGWTVPLGLSAIIVLLGIIMHWRREDVAVLQFEYPALGDADAAFDRVLAFLRRISIRITASTQRGSLSYNLGTIFVCLIALPLFGLIAGDITAVRMIVAENPWQAVAAVIIIIAAIAATQVHNRLSGAIIVGVTGYALGGIFALHGAPDLALTQILVETMILVLFMLVLRNMPADTIWRPDPAVDRYRIWLSVGVGVIVVLVAIFALNARTADPIAWYMPELAYEIGHGANAVNVLLVDMRAWDTFGEITVLAIAATGIISLVYRNQSFSRASRRPTLQVTGRRWLASGVDTEQALNRALMVEITTRILFPSMMALSAYFFFVGHNGPGGGFAGGLVAALALTLRYLAGGLEELDAALPFDGGRVMGFGLLASLTMIVLPMFLGHPPLTTYYTAIEVPYIGSVSLPSALVFDLGVYLVVIGLTLHVLHSLGGYLDAEEELRKQRARDRARTMRRRRTAPSTQQRRRMATARQEMDTQLSSTGMTAADDAELVYSSTAAGASTADSPAGGGAESSASNSTREDVREKIRASRRRREDRLAALKSRRAEVLGQRGQLPTAGGGAASVQAAHHHRAAERRDSDNPAGTDTTGTNPTTEGEN